MTLTLLISRQYKYINYLKLIIFHKVNDFSGSMLIISLLCKIFNNYISGKSKVESYIIEMFQNHFTCNMLNLHAVSEMRVSPQCAIQRSS